MPDALGSLTTRGLALLTGGLATVVASLATNQDALARLGVLAMAAPLLATLWVARVRHRLVLQRTVMPSVVPVGATATIALELRSEGRRTTSTLLLEEQVPRGLASCPRFTLEALAPQVSRRVTYQVRPPTRGRFEIGPLVMRHGDPFGLVELTHVFPTTEALTVTPWVAPLHGHPSGGAWTGSGDNRPRAFAVGSAEDVTVRDYRLGDDLRRVHWRSSARTGELMVRREEQPWQARTTVFLDNRESSHHGIGPASSLEAAVSVAASVAVHLTRQGHDVRLVTADGESHETQWHSHSSDAGVAPLLESLAVVATTSTPLPDMRWLAEPSSGGLTIGVFGWVSETDAHFLQRLRHRSATALAIRVAAEVWAIPVRAPSSTDPLSTLTGSGWRAVSLGPRDRLDVRWRDLVASTALRGSP